MRPLLLALALLGSTTGPSWPQAATNLNGIALPLGTPQPVAAPYSNGTMIATRELAARQQRYFVFATGNAGTFANGGLSVPANNYLNVRTCNISVAGSAGARNAFVTLRVFDSSSTTATAYGGVASPAPLSGTQISATPAGAGGTGSAAGALATTMGSNIVVGGSPSSVVQMTFGVGTTPLNNAAGNAVPSGTGFLYPGFKNELQEVRILPPGTCFGQYLAGLGGGLTAAVQLGFRMYEYEE